MRINNLSKAKFNAVCDELNLLKSKTRRKLLFTTLAEVSQDKTKLTRKPRKPKLQAVLNPKSMHYDGTPKVTKQVSLMWSLHQRGNGRLNHKRIRRTDRQWAHLVTIKREISVRPINNLSVAQTAKLVFQEGERLSRKMGKRGLYLSHLISMIDETLDNIEASRVEKITKAEIMTFKLYAKHREKATGIKLTYPVPGSIEHLTLREIENILDERSIGRVEFMRIHFDAFAVFGSFPRLRDLTTDKAIDRLDQGISKSADETPDPTSDKYWDEVNCGKNKTIR